MPPAMTAATTPVSALVSASLAFSSRSSFAFCSGEFWRFSSSCSFCSCLSSVSFFCLRMSAKSVAARLRLYASLSSASHRRWYWEGVISRDWGFSIPSASRKILILRLSSVPGSPLLCMMLTRLMAERSTSFSRVVKRSAFISGWAAARA